MSWSLIVVGRDKEKLKAAVREQQCKDEVNNPHSGVPVRVADHICTEIDRVRIYQFSGRQYALYINSSGSFHEQGCSESLQMHAVQLAEGGDEAAPKA